VVAIEYGGWFGFPPFKRNCDSFRSECGYAEVISTDCRIESQDDHASALEQLRFQLHRQSIIGRLSLSPEGFGVSRGLYLRIGLCTSCFVPDYIQWETIECPEI